MPHLLEWPREKWPNLGDQTVGLTRPRHLLASVPPRLLLELVSLGGGQERQMPPRLSLTRGLNQGRAGKPAAKRAQGARRLVAAGEGCSVERPFRRPPRSPGAPSQEWPGDEQRLVLGSCAHA